MNLIKMNLIVDLKFFFASLLADVCACMYVSDHLFRLFSRCFKLMWREGGECVMNYDVGGWMQRGGGEGQFLLKNSKTAIFM